MPLKSNDLKQERTEKLAEMETLNEKGGKSSFTGAEQKRFDELNSIVGDFENPIKGTLNFRINQALREENALLKRAKELRESGQATEVKQGFIQNDGTVKPHASFSIRNDGPIDSIDLDQRLGIQLLRSVPSHIKSIHGPVQQLLNQFENTTIGAVERSFQGKRTFAGKEQRFMAGTSEHHEMAGTVFGQFMFANPFVELGASSTVVDSFSVMQKNLFVSGLPTAETVKVGTSVAASDPTISTKQNNPSTVDSKVKIFVEHIEEVGAGPSYTAYIGGSIRTAVINESTRQFAFGDGATTDILGFFNYTNLTEVDLALGAFDSEVALADQGVTTDISNRSAVATPSRWGQIGKLKDVDNNPLVMPAVLEALGGRFRYVSSSAATGAQPDTILYGPFDQLELFFTEHQPEWVDYDSLTRGVTLQLFTRIESNIKRPYSIAKIINLAVLS